MQKENNIAFLMFASSAQRKQFRRKSTNPLKGINYDIDMYKRKFQQFRPWLLQSSREENTLQKKSSILSWFKKYMKGPEKYVFLFYSGHGDKKSGAWLVDTLDYPEGENLSFQEIAQVWNEAKNQSKCSQKHLFIFMDSCYSGDWCHIINNNNQIVTNYPELQIHDISIIAASSPGVQAMDLEGGLLYKCILGEAKYFKDNYLLLNAAQQNPIYFRNGKITNLQEQQIFNLNQDILNVLDFNNSSDSSPKKIIKVMPKTNETTTGTTTSPVKAPVPTTTTTTATTPATTPATTTAANNFKTPKIEANKSPNLFNNNYNQKPNINTNPTNNADKKTNYTGTVTFIDPQKQQLYPNLEDTPIQSPNNPNPNKNPNNKLPPQNTPPKIQTAKQWVDKNCHDFNNLQFQNTKITAKKWSYIFGQQKLSQKFIFSVIFNKIGQYIDLGIIDTKYKDKFDMTGSQNLIYYRSNGQLFDRKKKVGQFDTFQVGDKISVYLDSYAGKIQLIKNNFIISEYENYKLQDNNIGWVPYIYLFKQDSVCIVME